MTNLIKKTWHGDIGLAKAFWFGWVIPTILILFILNSKAYTLFLVSLIHISPSLSIFAAYAIPIILLLYQVFVIVAIWRSAKKYIGKRIWPIAARTITAIYIVGIIAINAYAIFTMRAVDTNDPGRDSTNIAGYLKSDPDYPLIGLWKSSCTDDFGLAIARAGDGKYSVSFCGPGGCFKPGTYRPDTPIYDDSNYKVIDTDTLKVKGLDGYSAYKRCE